ncbi:MAG: nicotinate-nicotinamide nucleotide adenylyltransferase [Candidatus Saccharimonadales bacterium]
MPRRRIGVYAGTFDPVHTGHITFALQAMKAANLDHVYFLPERKPRGKKNVEHYAHRVAMLSRALKPHPKFHELEMVEMQFTVSRTLPFLHKKFEGDTLVFLFGSDVVRHIGKWPNSSQLLKDGEFIIGLRNKDKSKEIKNIVSDWKSHPSSVYIVTSYAPEITSRKIRGALRSKQQTSGLLKSVEKYSGSNWLYVSLSDVGANVDVNKDSLLE